MKKTTWTLLILAILFIICVMVSAVFVANSGVFDSGTGRLNQEGIEEIQNLVLDIVNMEDNYVKEHIASSSSK